jgi:hypothetical protein
MILPEQFGNKNGTKTTDTQQLNAGSYGFTTTEGAAILTGVTAQNNDYTITYDGNLKVNKANLYYTYEGEREYGDANSTGSKTYTLVGTDDNSTTKSVDGLLKSFDKDKITTSPIVKSTDGTWTMTGTVATGNVLILRLMVLKQSLKVALAIVTMKLWLAAMENLWAMC